MTTMYFGYRFGRFSIATTDGSKPEKGDWVTIDESTLSDKQQSLLAEYRAAYKLASEAKAVFEANVRSDAGLTAPVKVKTMPKRTKSLADYLAERGQ